MVVVTQSIKQLCINSIRFLSIDAVEKAKSGHPGLPMGAAPMAFVLGTADQALYCAKQNGRNQFSYLELGTREAIKPQVGNLGCQ